MPETVVFLGPTMSHQDAAEVLPAEYRAPARMGSVYRAVQDGARIIALVDGYYERVPAVWHKEIIWALSAGVLVYGSSSMGALRAAELDRFGMIGVGEIYRWYRDGVIEDDDEVALFHAPEEGGYAAASEPLVNIRATLRAAADAEVLTSWQYEVLVRAAKARHYPDRTFEAVLADGAAADLDEATLTALAAWLPEGRVDLKRADALELLTTLAGGAPASENAPPQFEPTWIWQDLVLGQPQDSR